MTRLPRLARPRIDATQKTLSRALCLMLAGLQLLLPVTGALQAARADGAEAQGHSAYSFSFDVPDHGSLDLYHNAFTLRDPVSDSLYALRNTAVEDLLNTRKAIKILLGGTERARGLSHDATLAFDVPAGVVDLYLVGNLGADRSRGRDDGAAAGATALATPHGIEGEQGSPIAGAIRWLARNEPSYDENLRTRTLMGLVYATAMIAKYDQQLKFVQTDFWNDTAVDRQFYEQEIRPWEEATIRSGGEPDNGTMYDFSKREWLRNHGETDVLAALAGHREYLLDRYHLLAIEVDGKPLYQRIYEALENVGFPAASTVQQPSPESLPQGTDPIPLPTGFDRRVDAAFNQLMGPFQAQILSELSLTVNPSIDQALLASLRANTERLAALTSEIDYSGSRSSPLLELARYDDLWSTAQEKYGYLSGIIDFRAAHEQVQQYFVRRDRTARRVRYTAYGVGIGLGVVGMIASGGSEAAFLGIGAKAWLIGSGLVLSAQAVMDYVDSDEAAKVAKGLFIGTVRAGSHADMAHAVLMAEEDYRMMLASLILLGCELPILSTLAKGRVLIQSAGRVFVQVTDTELQTLRATVTALAERAEALAPMGRALLAMAKNLLGMVAGPDAVMALDEAIPVLAEQMRLAPAAIRARLEANPLVGFLLRGYRARVMASPGFLRTMLEQQASNFVVTLATEYQARGSHFRDELGSVSFDLVTGAAMTAALVWIGSPTAATAAETGSVASDAQVMVGGAARPEVQVSSGFSGREMFRSFLNKGKTNFIVGFTINGAASGVVETLDYIRHPESDRTFGDRALGTLETALYGATFMAVSSNARYQAYSWIENNIGRVISSKPAARLILGGLNLGNNYFGGWHYVKLAKFLGVQKDGQSVPADDDAAPDHALDPGISGLRVQELGGGYFRVDGDDDSAAYMFDFLRQGANAGPAPAT